MSNLVWQTGYPPAPGLYWCRRLLYGEPFCDPWIGEAVRTRKGCWWRPWGGHNGMTIPSQWCGPIEEPPA